MKKQTAVVGRWPLAVGLGVGAMCAGNVRVAHAGSWEIEPMPAYPSYGSSDYAAQVAAYNAEVLQRYPGHWDIIQSYPPFYPGTYTRMPHPEAPVSQSSVQRGTTGTASGLGGPASATYDSDVRVVVRYRPNTIQDINGQSIPDPADVPTRDFYLKVHVWSYGGVYDGTGDGTYFQQGQQEKTHLKFSVTPVTSVSPTGNESGALIPLSVPEIRFSNPTSSQQGKDYSNVNRDFYVKVTPNGSLRQTVPLVNIAARAALDGGRTTGGSGGQSLQLNRGSAQTASFERVRPRRAIQALYSSPSPSPSPDPPTYWNHGTGRISFGVGSELMNYSLIISSGEDSWRKLEGSLPQEYKKRVYVNGAWEWHPDPDKAQAIWTHPQIWRVKCLPATDGSMKVESAADYLYDESAGNILNEQWYGALSYTNLTAVQQGFSQPDYEWSLQGGQAKPYTSGMFGRRASDLQQINIGVRGHGIDISNHIIDRGIELGGTKSGPSVKSTTFTTKVRENDPVKPAAILDGKYTINWHSPSENNVVILSKDNYVDSPAVTTGTIFNSSSTQEENGSLEIWINPVPWQCAVALNGTDWAVISGVASLATGGAAYAVELGAGATIGSLSALGKAAQGFTVATGVTGGSWILTNTPTASLKQIIVNNSAEWGQAVDETLARSAVGAGQPSPASDPQIRIDPPSALDGYTATQLKDANWETNPLWKNCVMTPHIRQNYKEVVTTGDGYDRNGYVGTTRTTSSLPYGSPQIQGHYELQTSNTGQF